MIVNYFLKTFECQGGPFTLFAPTNDAFKALPETKLAKLMESPAELKSILLGHIVNGTYFLGGFMTSPDLRNLMGGFNQILANGTSKYIFFLNDKSFQCGLMKDLQKTKNYRHQS